MLEFIANHSVGWVTIALAGVWQKRGMEKLAKRKRAQNVKPILTNYLSFWSSLQDFRKNNQVMLI